MASAAEQTNVGRLESFDLFINSDKLADPRPGMGDHNIARTVLDMGTHIDALMRNPTCKQERKLREEVDERIDSKLKTALPLTTRSNPEERHSWYKSVLERKAT